MVMLTLSGCTLLTQTERRQCSDDAGCARRGLDGFKCSDQGVCVRIDCAADTDCAAAGEAFAHLICEPEGCVVPACMEDEHCDSGPDRELTCSGGRCVPATCQQDSDCADFGGALGAYICQGTRCEPPTCHGDGDCEGESERCDQARCVRTRCVNDAECRAAGGPFADYLCDVNTCSPPLCETDGICRALDTKFRCIHGRCMEPVWGCLGRRQPLTALVDRITVRARIEETTASQIPEHLSVQVCAGMDASCAAPVEAVLSLDKEGRTVFELAISDRGFVGVLLIRGDAVADVYYFVERALVSDTVLPPIRLFSPALVGVLASQDGSIPKDKGIIVSQTFDCQGRSVGGVDVSLDPLRDAVRLSITESNLPDVMNPTTSSRGLAVIVNIPAPDFVNLRGTIAATGERITQFTVPVFRDAATYANIDPR